MNETLEGMARALFKSWFVDFAPVRAKMDGRPVPGLDVATAALFPDGFEHADGELVPRGWKVCPLPEAIELNPGRSLAKGKSAPYLDMMNMPTAGHRAEELIDREFNSGTKFMNGDTLLARITPCLESGKTAFVDFLGSNQVGWGSTEYIVLRPRPPLPVEYGYYYLARSEGLRLHAIQNMTGTSGRQRVPPDCLDQFLTAMPPPSVAELFGKQAGAWMTQIRVNSLESRTLAALRDTVLPKLLSGEIRVANADKYVDAAIGTEGPEPPNPAEVAVQVQGGVQMEVKNKGIEFEVRSPHGDHLGDVVLTKTGLVWCKGKTDAKNGFKVSWNKFIEFAEQPKRHGHP